MKPAIMRVVLVIALLSAWTEAGLDWTITDGTHTLNEGDNYGIINILNGATLDVYGGQVVDIWAAGSSLVNCYGGRIDGVFAHGSSVVTVNAGAVIDHVVSLELGIVHLHGGTIERYVAAHGASELHVYGRDLLRDGWFLSGVWADGEPFQLYLRGPDTQPRVFLHEIPEPASATLFGVILVGFLVRRQCRGPADALPAHAQPLAPLGRSRVRHAHGPAVRRAQTMVAVRLNSCAKSFSSRANSP